MTEVFLDLLEYDVWANRLWIEALGRFDSALVGPAAMSKMLMPGPWPEFSTDGLVKRAGEILFHMMWAERIWLARSGNAVELHDASAEDWLEALNKGWRSTVQGRSPDELIAYRNSSGHSFTRTFGEIVRHAMNHGTYHRGQLREIAQWIPLAEYPETDYIGLVMEREAVGGER